MSSWPPAPPSQRRLPRVVRLTRQPARAGLLAGKVAVIYGAAGAIGGAVSRAFAREGAQLFLTGRTLERVAAMAKELGETGAVASPALVDAMDREAVEAHLADLVRSVGHIDITFNLIGLGGEQGQSLTAMTREAFDLPIANAMRTHFITATAPRVTWKNAAPASSWR